MKLTRENKDTSPIDQGKGGDTVEEAKNEMNNEGPTPDLNPFVPHQKHTLPELPYPYTALEPLMSKETLFTHHKKHHAGYIEKLNKLIAGTVLANKSLEDLILEAEGSVFNFAAQVWNHSFFWKCLTPNKNKPDAELADILIRDFGSVEHFKNNFKEAAKKSFGSGWIWLVQEPITSKLSILVTKDADNPLTHLKKPLLTCDLWEHAYYLDHKNELENYLDHFDQLVDWDFVKTNLFEKTQSEYQVA